MTINPIRPYPLPANGWDPEPNVTIGPANDEDRFKEVAEFLLLDPAADFDGDPKSLSKAINDAVDAWWIEAAEKAHA